MPDHSNKKVSVIIPCFNEENYIVNTVNGVISQDFPSDQIEIFVADGMSTDNTRFLLDELSKKYNNLHLVDNPEKSVPFAFNQSIPLSKGEYIVILGAHSEIPKNYISTLIKNIEELKADNVGGILETLPPDDTAKSKAIALACSSSIGMGNSYFRTGSDKIRIADTVPFGCYKREVFDEIGYFDTDLVRNQDDEFNARLTKNGGKIYLIPDLKFKYFSRDKYTKLWKMFYQYGLFKPVVSKKIGKPTTSRQLVPPTFVLSFLFYSIGAYFSPFFLYLLILQLSFYESLIFFSSIKSMGDNFKGSVMWHFICSVHVIHFSYGFGYINGFFQFVLLGRKPANKNVKSNR